MADSAAVARQCLEAVLARIEEAETELGRLDAAAGDGDHGMGMVRGYRAAVEAGNSTDGTAGQVLTSAGTAFADAAGGASGALVGMWIMTIGSTLNGDPIDGAKVHRALDAALNGLCKLGKAKPGDKTMIDALDPFVKTYGEAVEGGASLAAAWEQALPAAEAGMKSTADMISARGRSSRLGERSLGHVDPGAVSMFYTLQAVGEVLKDACDE